MLTPEQERQALLFDPFAGDKDDGGVTVLRNLMVTARKGGWCATPCGEPITPGQRVRKMVGILDGKAYTIRFCEPCCAAMAQDDPDEIFERTERGLALERSSPGSAP